MTELVSIVCDLCGAKLIDYPRGGAGDRWDLGVWFEHGTVGIPHICADCQDTTTIAQARRRLKLKTARELLGGGVQFIEPDGGVVKVRAQRFRWKLRADGVTFDVYEPKGGAVLCSGAKFSGEESLRLSQVTAAIRRAKGWRA